MADGGEGTAAAIAAATPGARWRDAGEVRGPDGRPVPGRWLELPDGTALVELAQVSGLPLMAEPDPLGASTAGLGMLLRRVVNTAAPARIVVAVGGSASTDGGAGALAELGLAIRTDEGAPVRAGGAGLGVAAAVDSRGLVVPPAAGVTVLVDVTAPLLGPSGAAAVFAPQKGAGPGQVDVLETALKRWAALLGGDPGEPGAGAAGGTAYGLAAGWGARLTAGASWVAERAGLTAHIGWADVVLTGEGRVDATSRTGKVVGEILRRASGKQRGVVAGGIEAGVLAEGEIWGVSLADLAGGTDASLADPLRWLHVAGERAALELAGAPIRGAAP